MNSSTEAGRPSGVGQGTRTPFAETADTQNPPHSPSEAVGQAAQRFAEVKEYASYYVAAKVDGLKATARRVGILLALGVVGLFAAVAVVITSVVLLLVGLAHAIGAALGGMIWLGDLIVAVGILGLLALGIYIGVSKITGGSRRSTIEKYEARKQTQRARFGHDISEQAHTGR